MCFMLQSSCVQDIRCKLFLNYIAKGSSFHGLAYVLIQVTGLSLACLVVQVTGLTSADTGDGTQPGLCGDTGDGTN